MEDLPVRYSPAIVRRNATRSTIFRVRSQTPSRSTGLVAEKKSGLQSSLLGSKDYRYTYCENYSAGSLLYITQAGIVRTESSVSPRRCSRRAELPLPLYNQASSPEAPEGDGGDAISPEVGRRMTLSKVHYLFPPHWIKRPGRRDAEVATVSRKSPSILRPSSPSRFRLPSSVTPIVTKSPFVLRRNTDFANSCALR